MEEGQKSAFSMQTMFLYAAIAVALCFVSFLGPFGLLAWVLFIGYLCARGQRAGAIALSAVALIANFAGLRDVWVTGMMLCGVIVGIYAGECLRSGLASNKGFLRVFSISLAIIVVYLAVMKWLWRMDFATYVVGNMTTSTFQNLADLINQSNHALGKSTVISGLDVKNSMLDSMKHAQLSTSILASGGLTLFSYLIPGLLLNRHARLDKMSGFARVLNLSPAKSIPLRRFHEWLIPSYLINSLLALLVLGYILSSIQRLTVGPVLLDTGLVLIFAAGLLQALSIMASLLRRFKLATPIRVIILVAVCVFAYGLVWFGLLGAMWRRSRRRFEAYRKAHPDEFPMIKRDDGPDDQSQKNDQEDKDNQDKKDDQHKEE